MSRSSLSAIAFVLTFLLAPLPAEAHRTWLLPSSTVLSGQEPWVTVDAAVADAPYWAGFHLVPYIGPTRIDRLLRRFGSLREAWLAAPVALRAVLDERALESLVKTRGRLDLDGLMERYERAGVSVVTRLDPRYPRLLAEISAPPPVLYVRGELIPEDDTAVGIVGTRRATAYGREVSDRLATDLASA